MLEFRRAGKAVLLSSHILSEVESIADRVVIIHKGKLIKSIARSELANLGGSSIKVTVRGLDQCALDYLKALGAVRVEGETAYVSGTDADPAKVNTDLIGMSYVVAELGHQKQGLEDYFLRLVGEANP